MSTTMRNVIAIAFGLLIVCVFGGIAYDKMLETKRAQYAKAEAAAEAAIVEKDKAIEERFRGICICPLGPDVVKAIEAE